MSNQNGLLRKPKGGIKRRLCRVALGIVFLVVLLFLIALALWGTRWTLPQATDTDRSYTLHTAWDGTNFAKEPFLRPVGVATGPNGDLYVTDARHRVVHLTSEGEFIGQWGSKGDKPGQFGIPMGIAVGPEANVFVADYGLDRIQKFSPNGKFLMEFGHSGSEPGAFDAPADVAIGSSKGIYVADFYNHRIQKFGPQGQFRRVIGRPGRLGLGATHYPTGVHITPDGKLLVADAYNYQLHWFTKEGAPTMRIGYHLLWLWPRPVAGRLGFEVPTHAAVGPRGLVHVADSGNHRVVMLSAAARYRTQWHIPDAPSKPYSPEQVAVSSDGQTIYATDLAGNRLLVLQITQP